MRDQKLSVRNSLGQKSCRTKVSRIFRILVPNFAPDFAPNFPRIFRGLFVLHFVGDGDQKKFTKNPRHFSMQNSQANTKQIFTKFFWRAGRVKFCLRSLVLKFVSLSPSLTSPSYGKVMLTCAHLPSRQFVERGCTVSLERLRCADSK